MSHEAFCEVEMDVMLALQTRCNMSLAALLKAMDAGEHVSADLILDLDEQLSDLADMSKEIVDMMKQLQAAQAISG